MSGPIMPSLRPRAAWSIWEPTLTSVGRNPLPYEPEVASLESESVAKQPIFG